MPCVRRADAARKANQLLEERRLKELRRLGTPEPQLCHAISHKDHTAIREIITEGVDLNWDGSAPVFLAILLHDEGAIRILVEAGASSDIFITKQRKAKLKTTEEIVSELSKRSPKASAELLVNSDLVCETDSLIYGDGMESCIDYTD